MIAIGIPRYAESRAGNLERMRQRNLAAKRRERRSRCWWGPHEPRPIVRLIVKDGETEPFGVCATCLRDVLARRGYRPFDGGSAA